jgi:hypothetical protein
MQANDVTFQNDISKESGKIQSELFEISTEEMKKISQQAVVLIEQQTYCQEMMELLINDLLDQAKFEND